LQGFTVETLTFEQTRCKLALIQALVDLFLGEPDWESLVRQQPVFFHDAI